MGVFPPARKPKLTFTLCKQQSQLIPRRYQFKPQSFYLFKPGQEVHNLLIITRNVHSINNLLDFLEMPWLSSWPDYRQHEQPHDCGVEDINCKICVQHKSTARLHPWVDLCVVPHNLCKEDTSAMEVTLKSRTNKTCRYNGEHKLWGWDVIYTSDFLIYVMPTVYCMAPYSCFCTNNYVDEVNLKESKI